MINLAGLQGIANSFLTTPVVIRRRSSIDKDSSNPTGDDISEFAGTTTSVMGWFLDKGTRTFTSGGGMGQVVDEPTMRLPVGTAVGSRDKLTFGGNDWIVIDASADETWPIFIKAELARIE